MIFIIPVMLCLMLIFFVTWTFDLHSWALRFKSKLLLQRLKKGLTSGGAKYSLQRVGAIESVSEVIHPQGRIKAHFYPSVNGRLINHEFSIPVEEGVDTYYVALKLHQWIQNKKDI